MSDFAPKLPHGGIEIINPRDKGLPDDLKYSALSNKTLAEEVKKLVYNHLGDWKFGGDEQGLLLEIYERLKSWS